MTSDASAPSSVIGRFYCQGIGDCHLLTFSKPGGADFRMLIDCGIHPSVSGGKATVDKIVDDIITATMPDHRIDVVVGTHEHWDHNSGFLTAAQKFKQLKVGEVWLAWTEDPRDPQAKRLDKFKGPALSALSDAKRRLNYLAPSIDDVAQKANADALASGLKNLLNFNFGVQGERSRDARDAVVALAPNNVRYLEPGAAPIIYHDLPNLRIYVLGPPRDEKLLGIRESATEMYGIGSGGWPEACALADALSDGSDEISVLVAPFEPELGSPLLESTASESASTGKTRQTYLTDGWRRIDNDWLASPPISPCSSITAPTTRAWFSPSSS